MATLQQMFSNRRLLILGISESVSNTGSWITMMAVYAMLVFRGGGDILSSSAVYLVGLVPTLLFSPVAGWLCDRLDRKGLMIASELVSGLVISGLIFVRQPVWIYALLGIQAISVSIMAPARQAVVPAIVPESELTRANAFLQQLNGIIKISAPALAGLVLAVFDPHQAIILDVVSFALSALILTRLPSLPPQGAQPAPDKSAPSAAAARGVWPALRQIEGLRMLFVAIFLAITVIIGFDVLAPIYTRDTLQGGESLFGLMISLVGLGTLGASLALMLRRSPAAPWRDLTLGLFLLAMIPAVMFGAAFGGASQARVVILIGALVGGVGNGLLTIQAGTLLQMLSPASLLGRMSGLFQSVGLAGQLVGILVTPLVVPALLPVTAYLAVMAAALLVVTALLAAYTLRGRGSQVKALNGD
jgi:MFS family permease